MQVHSLKALHSFLVERVGFQTVEARFDEGVVLLLDSDGDPLLLADAAVEDVKAYLVGTQFVFQPGDTVGFRGEGIPWLRDAESIRQRISSGFSIETRPWGERHVCIEMPDRYTLKFIALGSLEHLLDWYETGCMRELTQVLEGLAEAELDLQKAPEEWSIRYNVHHLAEVEGLYMMPILVALAQSGATLEEGPYDQKLWPEMLAYGRRALEPSLAFIRAHRQRIAQIVRLVPDSWERFVFLGKGEHMRRLSVRAMIGILVRHWMEHCDEIRVIRRAHDL
jgi:hypothetical protein